MQYERKNLSKDKTFNTFKVMPSMYDVAMFSKNQLAEARPGSNLLW